MGVYKRYLFSSDATFVVDRNVIFESGTSDYLRAFINMGSLLVNSGISLDIRVQFQNYGSVELDGQLHTRAGQCLLRLQYHHEFINKLLLISLH